MHFDRVFTVFLTMPVEMTSIMLLKTLYSLRALMFFRGDQITLPRLGSQIRRVRYPNLIALAWLV